MARTVITQEKIIEINELYKQIGTYAGVAKVIGCAPTTVKKYIIKDYVPKEQVTQKVFNIDDLPEFSTTIFQGVDNWGELCLLTPTEQEEIKELWNELVI